MNYKDIQWDTFKFLLTLPLRLHLRWSLNSCSSTASSPESSEGPPVFASGCPKCWAIISGVISRGRLWGGNIMKKYSTSNQWFGIKHICYGLLFFFEEETLNLSIRQIMSHLIQTIFLGHPSQFALQVDYLGFFAYNFNLKFVALLFQLPYLLAVLVFVNQALRHKVLGIISWLESLWDEESNATSVALK